MKFCTNCGAEVVADPKFCSQCGTNIERLGEQKQKDSDLNAKLDVSITNKSTEKALKSISESTSSSLDWLKKLLVKLFKLSIVLVILGVIGLAILFFASNYLEREVENRKMELRRIISESEIKFDDMRIGKNDRWGYEITGRVKNNSRLYTLDTINLKIFIYDCLDKEQKNCEIVFEDNSYLFSGLTRSLDEHVPPNQARDFESTLFESNNLEIKGNLAWSYQVEYIQAREYDYSWSNLPGLIRKGEY